MSSQRQRQRQRRVLMVVHSAKAAGAQLVALGQAEALAEDHELVIAIGHGPLRPRFERLGEIVRAPTRLPVWGATRPRWALEIARAAPDALRLAALARRRRIDVIVADSTVLVAPVLAGRLAQVPVIVYAQEAPNTAAARRLLRFHGALASTVVAISPWIERTLGPARSRVMMAPVGIRISEPDLAGVCLLRRGPVRLLVVGTVDAHKRQDLAIMALAELRAGGIDAVLEIVGSEDPPYAAALRDQARRLQIEDRVRFAGHSADVASHMRAADVLLVPAGEVTPLVLMEAMANWTPAVAARMGSIPDVVVDGESGLLFEPGDARGMAEAVRRLIISPDLAARLAAGGRERVEQHFDARRSHDALRTELAQLAGV